MIQDSETEGIDCLSCSFTPCLFTILSKILYVICTHLTFSSLFISFTELVKQESLSGLCLIFQSDMILCTSQVGNVSNDC